MPPILEKTITTTPAWPGSVLLGSSERAEITGAVAQLVPDWSVELSHGVFPTARIIITPEDGEDTSGPTLIISAENGGFKLDAFRWDSYWTIGEYGTWTAALRQIRKVVAWEAFVPITAH